MVKLLFVKKQGNIMDSYRLKSVFFKNLKGLRDVKIVFEKPLTAIMGVNGSGKTTVIHALVVHINLLRVEKEKIIDFLTFSFPIQMLYGKAANFVLKMKKQIKGNPWDCRREDMENPLIDGVRGTEIDPKEISIT